MEEPVKNEDAPPAADPPREENQQPDDGNLGKESKEEHNGEPEMNKGNESSNGDVIGSAAMRPVFLGNLHHTYTAEDVQAIFDRPILPDSADPTKYSPVPVERVDMKRGYCFVFLKDARNQAEKDMALRFVEIINGMGVPQVSDSIRAEFARGDGRVKRKEDERKRNIAPSDTLFVVNFNESTTKREDLQALFEPFGDLLRIDMKKNYAFVQFKTIEQATNAKERTNGGKLDQSVLTVEYVAQPRMEEIRRRDGRRDHNRGRGRGGDRYDDRGRFDGPPDRRGRGGPPYGDRGYDRDRRQDRDRYGGYDRDRRSRSPGYRRRSRSRSRSPGGYGGPPRYGYRDRSPPRGGAGGRYDDRYDEGGRRGSPPGDDARGDPYSRPPSMDHRDRDRGYRA